MIWSTALKKNDADGRFDIQFDESYFKEIFFDRKPDLFFKVFQNDELIKSTEDSLLWNVEAGETEIEIKVDIPTPSQIFKVKGTVLQPEGTPLAGVVVKAFDKDLRHEEELGEVSTNQAGEYEFTYTRQQPGRVHSMHHKHFELALMSMDRYHFV
jgi:protocatechuate 3,4-dioxygenase beta subunit